MRKLYPLLFIALLWAQEGRRWQIGPQVALNIPAYRGNKPVEKVAILPGFTGGVQFRYALSKRWALRSGLYFSQRNTDYLVVEATPGDTVIGGTLRDEYIVYIAVDGRLEIGHIELPVLMEWNFLSSPASRSYMLFGLHAGYLAFARNYGKVQVSLEGLDFLPLFGFSPQTRVIVAEGPIDKDRIVFRRGDAGVWFGGGNAYPMGKGQMSFEIRAFFGLVNIFAEPKSDRLYNGSIMFMTGYAF